MVYYLSSRRDVDSGDYAMSMDLNTLTSRQFSTSYSALTWLLSVPLAVFIVVVSLLALLQPGICCTVDPLDNKPVFSRSRAFGVAFVVALISLAITAFFLSRLD